MKQQISTRQPKTIKDELERIAKKNKRSLTKEVEIAFENHIKNETNNSTSNG